MAVPSFVKYGVLTLAILISNLSKPIEAENILVFIGFGGASHRIAIQPLANALVDKGHNVTFILQDPFEDKQSSIQYRTPQKLYHFFNSLRNGSDGGGGINFYDMRAGGRTVFTNLFIQWFGVQVCENVLTDEDFKQWLSSVPKFDLVIMDGLFNECGYGIAHAHGAKTMIFSISTILPWVIEAYGTPDESAMIPEVMSSVPLEMNFMHRVVGALAPILWRALRTWVYLPRLGKVTQEGLNLESMPDFIELERNTSLVLVNVHASQEFPRALPPNVIPVGGIAWVEKRKQLPQKFEDFINAGKEGFIYVSFGSFIDFLTFPEEVQQTFIRALKRFPNIQFIWKLNKTPKDLPKHILVDKWLPQQDLLFHPKIRAFITHSGIGGVTEAIYSSVPLICFPMFSEQDYNAQLAEKRGFAIKMEITALTEQGMVNAIQRMLNDKSFKENVAKVTKQFSDRPMKPLDTAVWWTEFVLRQESTEYLRPHFVDYPWWKKRQLDVWLFLLITSSSLLFVNAYIALKLVKYCCCKSSQIKTKHQKRKQQ